MLSTKSPVCLSRALFLGGGARSGSHFPDLWNRSVLKTDHPTRPAPPAPPAAPGRGSMGLSDENKKDFRGKIALFLSFRCRKVCGYRSTESELLN